MAPYLLLIGIIILEGLLYKAGRKDGKTRTRFVVLVCLELILFAGFRADTIGVDTKNYIYALSYFKSCNIKEVFTLTNPWNINYEIGYMFLTKLVAALGVSNTGFLFIIAILIYVPVFMFIKDESNDVVFSAIMYICFELFAYSLGIFRQMIAVSFLLFAFRYVKRREPIKYFLVVIIAMTFHMSAIIAIPVYFFYKIKIKNVHVLITFVLEIIVLFTGTKIVSLIFSLFPKYLHYIGSQYGGSGGGYSLLLLLHAIFICGLVWGNRMIYSESKQNNEGKITEEQCENNVYLASIMVAILLTALAHTFSVISRMNCLFLGYIIAYIPNLLEKMFDRKNRFLVKTVVIVILIIYFYSSIVNEPRLNPYTFIWM